MPLCTAPNQDVLHFFGLLIHLLLNVVHVGENRKRRAETLHLAVIDLVVVEKNRLVRSLEPYRAGAPGGPQSERYAPSKMTNTRPTMTGALFTAAPD